MFRRKRNTSQTPINSNPSPSAQTAAVQAFRASQAANANLSSSAAAAALRKHTPPPTSVKDVQTKRMLQRQSSSTSTESSKRAPRHDVPHGGLKRSQSSGSMTNRTFRERAPASSNRAAREIIDVPPLPRKYVSGNQQHQRRFSVDPQYRAVSPPHRRVGGNSTPTSIDGFLELDRHSSRGSINFSYPMNGRPNSPSQSSTFSVATDSPRQLVPSPTLPNNDLMEQPARWKDRPQIGPGSDNESVMRSSMSPDPRATSPDRSKIKSRRTTSGPDRMGSAGEQPQAGLGVRLTNPSEPDRSRIAGATDEHYGAGATASTLKDEQDSHREGSPQDPVQLARLSIPKKRLSTMLEVESGENSPQSGAASKQGLQPEPEHELSNKGRGPVTDGSMSVKPSEKTRTVRNTSDSPELRVNRRQQSPAQKETQAAALRLLNSPSQQVDQQSRSHSLSPTRSTRFSGRLEVFDSGEPLHEPPPRSKSPAKSALKSAASSQATNPGSAFAQRTTAFDAPSETSEGTSVLSEDGLKKVWKRKAPKVSFGDETEIIDHPQSPPTSPESYTAVSPQFKGPAKTAWRGDTNWFRPRNMDDQDDFDEVLKPRPILPFFGSVRGGRPSMGDGESTTTRNVGSAERATGTAPAGHSFSTDSVIGGILSNSKNRPHQIEDDDRFSRPLPPEVTSVNGTGYTSSSADSSSSDEGPDLRYFPPRMDKRPFADNPKPVHTEAKDSIQYPEMEKNDISPPAISVQPPTPAMEETKYDRDLGTASENSSFEENHYETQVSAPDVIGEGNSHTEGTAEAEDSESDDTGASIYSDAVEDISDLEGDGFGSIDAIVDTSSAQHAPETASHSHEHIESESEDEDMSSSSATRDVNTPLERSAEDVSAEIQQQPHDQPTEQHTVQGKKSFQEQTPAADITIPEEPDKALVFEPKQSTTVHESLVLSDPEETTRRRYPTQPEKAIDNQPTNTKPKTSTHDRNVQNHNGEYIRKIPQRTRSQGSDSSSSFRRMRPARQSGRYSLKRTMRGAPGSSDRVLSDGVGRASTFTGYAGERRPMSSGDGRSTMRATMRQPPASSKSTPFAGLRKRKSNGIPGKSQPIGSEFNSRFADSSDDEMGTSTFRPVRGIPRRKNEVDGDSTDLEDSSDNEPRNTLRRSRTGKTPLKAANDSAMAAAMAHVLKNKEEANAASVTSQGRNGKDTSYPVPPNADKPRGGLFSRLKRNRRNDESKIRKSNLDSPARRDTPLERSRSKRGPHNSMSQGGETLHTSDVGTAVSEASATEPMPRKWQPVSPRLQKRLSKTTHRSGSDSWPLRQDGNPIQRPSMSEVTKEQRPHTAAAADGRSNGHRPHTSDGITENGTAQAKPGAFANLGPGVKNKSSWKSRFLNSHSRRDTAATDASSVGTSAASDMGPSMGTRALKSSDKRARFPMLKKAFGLGR